MPFLIASLYVCAQESEEEGEEPRSTSAEEFTTAESKSETPDNTDDNDGAYDEEDCEDDDYDDDNDDDLLEAAETESEAEDYDWEVAAMADSKDAAEEAITSPRRRERGEEHPLEFPNVLSERLAMDLRRMVSNLVDDDGVDVACAEEGIQYYVCWLMESGGGGVLRGVGDGVGLEGNVKIRDPDVAPEQEPDTGEGERANHSGVVSLNDDEDDEVKAMMKGSEGDSTITTSEQRDVSKWEHLLWTDHAEERSEESFYKVSPSEEDDHLYNDGEAASGSDADDQVTESERNEED